MVAKKTAAKKSTAAGSAGAGVDAKGVAGKKSTVAKKAVAAAPAGEAAAGKTVVDAADGRKAGAKKTASGTTTKKTASGTASKKTTTATKKTATRKTASGNATRKTATASTDPAAGKTPAAVRKAPAKKAPARTATAGKAASAKKQTGARTVAVKKTAGGVTTVEDEAAVPPARAGELAVRPGEDPWTPEEVAEARSGLEAEVVRLRSELAHSQQELTGLMRDSGDGAGDDQADTGTKNITREHELALAANAREMLEQTEHALERLDAGTYGLCEVCGKPIGKARMQAFPRATLCVEDKQRQERRG